MATTTATPDDTPPPQHRGGPFGAILRHPFRTLLALLAIAIVLLIIFWDWNWFRRPIEKIVHAKTGRVLHIAGNLDVRLGWVPTISAERITFSNAPWAKRPLMATSNKVTLKLELKPLLRRQVRITEGALAATRRCAVYVVYPRLGLQDSHLTSLAYLARKGCAPLVVSNLPLTPQERERLQPLCWRLVERPNYGYDFGAYREGVLPSWCRKRVAVEAGVTDFWRKYVGLDGAVVGLDTFGASAPADALYRHFGITAENVADVALALR